MSGHVLTGSQNITGVGVMGNAGESDQRHMFMGGQTISKEGFGLMGDVATAAIPSLRQPDDRRGADRAPADQVEQTEDGRDAPD